ncbi:uncharacterized protein LOC128748793 isoform X2 [Synchiropus splendidus]|nr:uncharacterized protein LOC128748793 isoform X2 [Synchiropus splendidus]
MLINSKPNPRAGQDSTSSTSEAMEVTSSCDSVMTDSLPSPEIFRGDEDTLDSHMEDSQPPLNVHNSTLLDLSLATDLDMHPSPNVSNITDASTVLAEDIRGVCTNKELGKDMEVLQPGEVSEFETPPKITRKVLTFKKICAVAKQTAQTADANSALSGMDATGDTVDFGVPPKRLRRSLRRGPVLFDFQSEAELEEFFQRLEKRSASLRSLTLFPRFVPDSPPC